MSVSGRQGAAKLSVVQRPGSESLEKFRAGELTLEQYLDERVEKSLAHIKGKVTANVLAQVRETVRESLRTDPVLVESVRQTTGQVLPTLTHTGKK
jgi:hypothetical protein